MTKLVSQLPKGSTNGLNAIWRELVDDPHAEHIVVGIVDCKKTEEDHDNGDHVPHARFRAIEVIDGVDGRTARHLLETAYAKRTGQDSLTLDQLDPETGEIHDDDDGDPDTDLVAEALDLVVSTQFASPSMLQRKLKIGGVKAARIMDQLEGHGVIGPSDGHRARDVLIAPDRLDEVVARLRADQDSDTEGGE